MRLAAGASYRKDLDLVFPEPTDGACGYWAPHASGDGFRYFLTGSGLPRVRFHDLRHACATLMLRAQVPLKVVSDCLGHAGIGITADIYAHVLDDQKEDAYERLGASLRKRDSAVS